MKKDTIYNYLSHIPTDEITNRLRYIDACLKELHEHGLYVVCNMIDIRVIDNQITLASFKNQVDYLDSGFNKNGDKQDILELASIGVCAYNHFDTFYSSVDFIKNLMENLDLYINNGKVPKIMREYYVEVFGRGNVVYLNFYLLNTDINVNVKQIDSGEGRESGMVKTKTTEAGRLFSEKEAAYAKILLLPAILALVYLVAVVCYFIFFR